MMVHEATYICSQNSIYVYPIVFEDGFKIEVKQKEKIKRFDKKIKSKEVCDSMKKTYIHFAEQLKTKQL